MSTSRKSKRSRTLSGDEEVVKAFENETDASKVATLLRDNGGRGDEVAEAARKAVRRLALDDYHDDYDENKTTLDEDERCELVVEMLRAFGTSNEKVAEEGCLGVWELTCQNDFTTKKIGDLGGCQVVVDALRAFGGRNAIVAKEGCRAVTSLSYGNDDNQKNIGNCGGCQVVVSVMRALGTTNKIVASAGCWAVIRLCQKNDKNREKLVSLGAVDVVKSFPKTVCMECALGLLTQEFEFEFA